jgi:hypothetical protein
MTKRTYRLIAVLIFTLAPLSLAQEFKRYKNAKPDTAATEEAMRLAAADQGLDVSVYITSDPFEKVYEFYKGVGREYQMAGKRARKLPNGQELRDAFILLDNEKNIVTSKMWVKIQRPYIGAGLDRKGAPTTEIRDVTAIVLSQRK